MGKKNPRSGVIRKKWVFCYLWTGSSGQDAPGKTYTEYAGLWHQRTVRPVVHLSAFGA